MVLVNGTRVVIVKLMYLVLTRFQVQKLCQHGTQASKNLEIEDNKVLLHRIERAVLVKIILTQTIGVVGHTHVVDRTLRTATIAIRDHVHIHLTLIIIGGALAVLPQGLAREEDAVIRTVMTVITANLIPILEVGEVGHVRVVMVVDFVHIHLIVVVQGVTVDQGLDRRVAHIEDTVGVDLITRVGIKLDHRELLKKIRHIQR